MEINLSTNKKSGSGCLTIFGGIFLLTGLFIGFLALKNLYTTQQAKSWESVQATILSADLKVKRGDDAITYLASGKFSYRYEGTSYTSDKLFFGRGSDNFGTFHQDLVREMNNVQSRNQTMQAWVNPKDHSQAVLIRDIRWSMFGFMMMFSLVFGGVGAGIVYAGRYAKKAHAKEIKYQELYPQQPWMWKEEWQSNIIKSSNKSLIWFSVIFASIWCLISTPILFIIPDEVLNKKNYLALIALLFPIVGIGLVSWAIRNYLQWRKFGESELHLNDMPARLGRTLNAKLQIPAELHNQEECMVIVECVHKYTSGSGKNSSTREHVLWQDQQRLKVNPSSFDEHTLPLEFKLPNDMPVTDTSNSRNQHFWRVRAESKLSGVDYAASFIIPVYTIDQLNLNEEERYEEDFFAELDDVDSTIDHGDWQQLNLTHQQTVQGSEYTFGRARLKSMLITLTVMTAIFGGVGIGMFIFENGSKLFGIIFSLIGILLGWGALHQWLYKSQFTVTYNQLTLTSGWFMHNSSTFKLNQIKRIYKDSNLSANNVKYYAIYIDTQEKDKIKIAENLVGNRDIDNLIAKISEELGFQNK